MSASQWRQDRKMNDVLANSRNPASNIWPSQEQWHTGYVAPPGWFSFIQTIRMVGELDVSRSLLHSYEDAQVSDHPQHRIAVRRPTHYPKWLDMWDVSVQRLKGVLERQATSQHPDACSWMFPSGSDHLVLDWPLFDITDNTRLLIPATDENGSQISSAEELNEFDHNLIDFIFSIKHPPTKEFFVAELVVLNKVADL